MGRFSIHLLLVGALVGMGIRAALAADPPGLEGLTWEKLGDRDGIQWFRAEVPDSPVLAFRGRGRIAQSIFKVANVLVDLPRRPEWMTNVRETHLVRTITPTERVEYARCQTPLFVAERDFVIRARAQFDVPGRAILLLFDSIDEPQTPPRECCVRGRLIASGYRLRELDGGAATEIDFWTQLDPRGMIPKWIVNAFQQTFPREMIESIRDRSNVPGIAEHEGIKRVFSGGRFEASAPP